MKPSEQNVVRFHYIKQSDYSDERCIVIFHHLGEITRLLKQLKRLNQPR